MKFTILFINLFLFSSVLANPLLKSEDRNSFQVYQVNPKSDISKFEMRKNYLKDIPKKKKLVSRSYRDKYLKTYLPKKSKSWDELEKDLFVRRLESYKQADFLQRYKTVSSEQYLILKKHWRPNV